MTKWKLVPVEPTPEMYQASRLTTESEGIVTTTWLRSSVYRSMLEAAPQPPALSDERIFKLFLEKAVDKGTAGIYDFAHAIEREILGENNESN